MVMVVVAEVDELLRENGLGESPAGGISATAQLTLSITDDNEQHHSDYHGFAQAFPMTG